MNIGLQLNPSEVEMMEEVFSVFEKYAHKTREFGIQLKHDHFPIHEGEILLETHDKQKRELSVSPKMFSSFTTIPKATAWQKSNNGKIEVTMLCCDSGVVIKP